ncbi:MAG TPA: flagellar export protein FliJ [Lacunisphaera sp.]|jgi:flagellar FliJ protein
MKKFRFPLRPVAILREHHQARTREAFAATVRAFADAGSQLDRKREERCEVEALMQNGRRAIFRAADEISLWAAYRRICDAEKQAEQNVLAARAAMEESRQKYLEAHRAVKVVENLEQKARTEHRRGIEREAQLESDELAGLRVGRRLAAATVSTT